MLIDVDECYGPMPHVITCSAENNAQLVKFRTRVEYGGKDSMKQEFSSPSNVTCVPSCPGG
ncbi:MAG: hypothetical protein QXF28_06420 [Nitrososphaerota archaeon]